MKKVLNISIGEVLVSDGVTIKILGSGTSTGVPVVGCSCDVCRSAESRNKRSRCSALLSWDGYQVLIDSSPDLRQQCLVNGITQLDAVLYTHNHADHVHGIDDLRVLNGSPDRPLSVYGAQDLIQHLTSSFRYAFESQSKVGFRPRLKGVVVDATVSLFGRKIIPIQLLHGDEVILGYRIGDLAYLTDCSVIPEKSVAKLQGLQVLVIDGLRFRNHPTHFTVSQAIDIAKKLKAERVVLTHLSHDVDYFIHQQMLPQGVEFAYDGLTISLNDGKKL